MIEVTKYRGETVGVFGLGKSGLSTIYSLIAGGSSVIAWDDDAGKRNSLLQDIRPEFLALPVQSMLVDLEDPKWNSISALILSPGVPLYYPAPHKVVQIARSNNCPVICDIGLLCNTASRAKYIAITGTNGKSTTTSLIGHILTKSGVRTEVGGNIGTAALTLQPLGEDGAYVLELSSYQLELLEEAHFHIAIILNITKDHLDRYHTMENYIRAKKNICRYQAQQDAVVINIDNEITKQIYSELQAEGKIGNIIPISTQRIVEKGVSVIGHTLYNNRGQQLELGELLYLKGKHNAENIAASFAACQIYGLQAEQIIQAMQTYPGLEHRMQHIDKVGKITFVNDSKATNAEAAQHALQAFDNIYWIAGGVAKEGGITSLTSCFNNINHAFLIGAAQEEYALVLQQAGINYTKCGDLASAFEAATRLACQEPVQDAVVLLSPACASYDQWENFEQRGQAFCNLVHKYKHKMQERTLQHS